jgi:hypothetical protein
MSENAAIYPRVSTDKQTVDNQRPDLERVAEARGVVIVATYEERASAAKRRPSFDCTPSMSCSYGRSIASAARWRAT